METQETQYSQDKYYVTKNVTVVGEPELINKQESIHSVNTEKKRRILESQLTAMNDDLTDVIASEGAQAPAAEGESELPLEDQTALRQNLTQELDADD